MGENPTLGVGFSYEEIFEMCQRVTKMDSLQTRSMSPLSLDMEGCKDSSAGRRRRAISFRKHVSEQSAQSAQSCPGSEDKSVFRSAVKIIGGNTRLYLTQL